MKTKLQHIPADLPKFKDLAIGATFVFQDNHKIAMKLRLPTGPGYVYLDNGEAYTVNGNQTTYEQYVQEVEAKDEVIFKTKHAK